MESNRTSSRRRRHGGRRFEDEVKVSKLGRKTRHLEGHEEISKATRSPRREGGPEVETDVSQDNWRFSRREEDLEIKKDKSKAKSQQQGDIEGMEVSTARGDLKSDKRVPKARRRSRKKRADLKVK